MASLDDRGTRRPLIAFAVIVVVALVLLGQQLLTGRDAADPGPSTPTPSSSGSPSGGPSGTPSTPSDPYAALAAAQQGASLVRLDFCLLLDQGRGEPVRRALDLGASARVPAVERVVPGDSTQVGGSDQPVSEYSCAWSSGASSALARVFAPPVDAQRGRGFVRSIRAEGCERLDAPELGDVGATTSCEPDTVRAEGLVGDTWLVCRVTRPDLGAEPSRLAAVTARWCADVVSGLDRNASP